MLMRPPLKMTALEIEKLRVAVDKVALGVMGHGTGCDKVALGV
jgi:hypothetical protein